MVILQNKKTGEIKKIRTGFDWATFICFFLGLSFIPSLFRKDIISAIALFIAEILPFFGLYFYIEDKSHFTSILLLLLIYVDIVYTIIKCATNRKRIVNKFRNKGFEPVLLNDIFNRK